MNTSARGTLRFSAMGEIAGAIVAITLVMSAVFVPVAFMSGPVGIFYRQFSLTLAIAIVISGINALTLTPALCAILLKPHEAGEKKSLMSRFFARFNKGYDKLANTYSGLLRRLLKRGVITWGILAAFIAGTWGVSTVLPGGFIPTEDQGMIYANVTTPAGATVSRTEKVLDEIQELASKEESVENVSTLAGYSLLTDGAGASYGMGMINLKPWDERNRVDAGDDCQTRRKSQIHSGCQHSVFSAPHRAGIW